MFEFSFGSVYRVDSGLGQWFIAGWLKVGAKFYQKSLQGLIRNLSKIDSLSFGFGYGFGFVLGLVKPLFGISFRAYLRFDFKVCLQFLS